MKIHMRPLLAAICLPLTAFSQTGAPQDKPKTEDQAPPQTPSPKPLPDQVQKPVAEEHTKPGFRLSNLDRSVDPCQDFYKFACGTWIKENPVPSDQPSWDSFTAVYDQNQKILHGILEKAQAPDPSRNVVTREIGDFYAACMDESAAETKGIAAIKPELDRIAAIQTPSDVIEAAARINLLGPNPIFGFGSQPDYHDASMEIASFDQAGITLPDRDYYLKDDEKTKAIRDAYRRYVQQIFELSGLPTAQASKNADTVLAIETDLAKISMDRTLRRDPKATDHPMTVAQLEQLAPKLQLTRYIRATGSPEFTRVNVGNPDFFKGANALMDKYPVGDWKTYLTFQLTDGISPWLSKNFVDAHFKFEQNFTGQQENQVRWKRCVDRTDRALGEALGQRYVEEAFGPEAKARMLTLVHNLETALGQDIASLSWMTPATKQQARVKLEAVANKIGYPDKWRDYSSIEIRRDDLAGNVFRTNAFESRRQLNKIGKPVDRTEWGMTPPTVNAYYNPLENNINFPAGILQPPFFDQTMDNAVNYGGIGMVIGHELTHGFDDQGRQFDAKGDLRDWWTATDAKEFEQRAACVVNEYNQFEPVPGVHLNGKLTLGENTADNGGARIALMALHNSQNGAVPPPKDGFTADQRFFLGFANVWCENRTQAYARMLATVDPHSPGEFRTNGVLENMPEFQQAWGCKAGQGMVKPNPCRVW